MSSKLYRLQVVAGTLGGVVHEAATSPEAHAAVNAIVGTVVSLLVSTVVAELTKAFRKWWARRGLGPMPESLMPPPPPRVPTPIDVPRAPPVPREFDDAA